MTDVTKQYNEMSLAVNDIVSTGGARLDDSLLISMFENSLPTSYASIRQMVRYNKAHTVFNDFYNDLLVQVKQRRGQHRHKSIQRSLLRRGHQEKEREKAKERVADIRTVAQRWFQSKGLLGW